jgi:mandelate racemase
VSEDSIVESVRVRRVSVPFRRQPRSASGPIPSASLVLIDLRVSGGVVGRSYLFGFAPWSLGPIAASVEALFAMILGDRLAPLEIEAKLRRSLKLLDTPGLVGLALAGLDMAAWDALAQQQQLPLAKLLGGSLRPARAYNSCGLWIQPVEGLADEAEQLRSEGGFRYLKLRLGRDDAAQDLAAVRAVKQRLGDSAELMVDYNQRLSVVEAVQRGRALEGEGLVWIEEPTRHDDYRGHASIRAALTTPVQIGENMTSTHTLEQALSLGALDYVMPDVQRIGGVSGWLRASALAHAHGIAMSSHLFPEFSAHLLSVTPSAHLLEYVDWAEPILAEPYVLRDGELLIPDRPGAGITWNEEAVTRYELR